MKIRGEIVERSRNSIFDEDNCEKKPSSWYTELRGRRRTGRDNPIATESALRNAVNTRNHRDDNDRTREELWSRETLAHLASSPISRSSVPRYVNRNANAAESRGTRRFLDLSSRFANLCIFSSKKSHSREIYGYTVRILIVHR